MADRRQFLKTFAGAPVAGALLTGCGGPPPVKDYFAELGVRTFLNAAGTYTTLTGSLMCQEAVAAWNYASKFYVRLDDLQDAVGKRIAERIGCEAAMVTSGAASALTLGTAACMTGTNREFIDRIPNTEGMKDEVIMQKAHRYGYDHAVRNCGVKIVEVETMDDLEQATAAGKTAMMLFLNFAEPRGQIKAPEFIRFGKEHGIPTFNDAAADVPPPENLSKYTKMGFDLVTFSGGKGLRGPQSAGLLLGRKDLIHAARLNAPPRGDTIGRGMKVNKEEILAMLATVEAYLDQDADAAARELERRARLVVDAVKSIPGVKTDVRVPPIANHVPHVHITWDQAQVKITVPEVKQKLREGKPSIEVTPSSDKELVVNPWMLSPGEPEIVARRVGEVLQAAAGGAKAST